MKEMKDFVRFYFEYPTSKRLTNPETLIKVKIPIFGSVKSYSTSGSDKVLQGSRTGSVGKVDDSESGGPRFESRHGHLRKNLLVLLDKALYLRLSWIMTTFCPSIMRMAMAP